MPLLWERPKKLLPFFESGGLFDVYTASIIDTLSGCKVRGALPVDLIPTDRVIQRWHISVIGFLPTQRWDESKRARLSPLDDVTAIVVDQIICSAPERHREIIWAWYGTPAPTRVIAEDLGISPSGLKLELHSSLTYMLLKFKGSQHAELIRLLLLPREGPVQNSGRPV